jgi:5-methylcytosine-specific restriction protein A
MSNIKITNEAVHQIYDLAKSAYKKQLTEPEAIEIALNQQLMSEASAKMYIVAFNYMIAGKTYKKTINQYATEYFLNSLHSDFGLPIFQKAIVAVKDHLEHYKKQGKGGLPSIRNLILKLEEQHNLDSIVYVDELSNADEFIEGARFRISVNAFERSKKARDKCLEIHGLNCKVCDINFEQVYGVLGRGFIHVHHLNDLANISKEYKVNPEADLVPVCPNCHAMLHQQKPSMTVESLINILKCNQKNKMT